MNFIKKLIINFFAFTICWLDKKLQKTPPSVFGTSRQPYIIATYSLYFVIVYPEPFFEDEEESEEEEQVIAETPGMQDPDYDDFYDSPYIDDIDPYQLQLDVDRQATIIIAQKNRIFELEERVQKQIDLHAMEIRQLREKQVEQLKQGEAHMEKRLQQMREKHIGELEGVRDRAKNVCQTNFFKLSNPLGPQILWYIDFLMQIVFCERAFSLIFNRF